MVTESPQLTVLSVLVEARLVFVPFVAPPAGMVATTVPAVVMPVTATVYVVPLPVTAPLSEPPAVLPVNDTSLVVKPVTLELNTTVNRIGDVPVGSACPAA